MKSGHRRVVPSNGVNLDAQACGQVALFGVEISRRYLVLIGFKMVFMKRSTISCEIPGQEIISEFRHF